MLSTLILSKRSYPAMLLAEQPEHHWFVHFGPLVLEAGYLKYLSLATDRDQTVSRRFEPNSRTALIGEQPNPWDLLQPQDRMSRHRCRHFLFLRKGSDYIFILCDLNRGADVLTFFKRKALTIKVQSLQGYNSI